MKLSDYLTSERVIFLSGKEKDDAFSELVAVVCRSQTNLNNARILSRVWNRENLLTTKVAPGIAIPHAKVPDIAKTMVAVGVSKEGVDWQMKDSEPIHLIVLILGYGADHIQVLSMVAQVLSRRNLLEHILEADSPEEVYKLLTRPLPREKAAGYNEALRISRSTFEHGLSLAVDSGAQIIILHPDPVGSLSFLPDQTNYTNIILVTEEQTRYEEQRSTFKEIVQIPFRGLRRASQVDLSILFLLSQGLLERGDKAISILGNIESGILDSIILTDVEREYKLFFSIRSGYRPRDLGQQVFARVIQIAHELAIEGREGRPVGTTFVLGDHENVLRFSRQLLVNPFQGYQEEERNILDPSLEETVKEFSRIDGAFIVRGDGVILSAGTYLQTQKPITANISGLGARHTSAAGITAATAAISIAISESTKKVSIFSAGERVMVF